MTLLTTLTSPIGASFAKILAATALQQTDHAAFAKHEAGIRSSLEASFAISKFVRIGSYERGSAVRGNSDLDLLAVLTRDEVTWAGAVVDPGTLLDRVRRALKTTFWNTALGRDGQAVVVDFADGRSVDVVPAWYAGPISPSNGWPLYYIPSGTDWLPTAPDFQNSYITNGDAAAGGKLKSVMRILKYWKRARSEDLPLGGFHLELLLTKERTCCGARTIASCVADAFELLANRECRALQDPCGVSGYVRAAASDAKRARLAQAVGVSANWARDAVYYEAVGNIARARYYWSLVFNGAFS